MPSPCMLGEYRSRKSPPGSGYFDLAVDLAFEMSVGFSADALCGVLDVLSCDSPIVTWERVHQRVDLERVAAHLRHVGRYVTLCFITGRARDAGSESAETAHNQLTSLLRDGAIELDTSEGISLPRWADCIADRWKRLEGVGVTTLELRDAVQSQLATVCSPFSIEDVRALEDAVLVSFRDPQRMPFDRWQAKVHFALSVALFPYVSGRNIEHIAEAMRVFSPTAPCRSRSTEYVPPSIKWSQSMTDSR